MLFYRYGVNISTEIFYGFSSSLCTGIDRTLSFYHVPEQLLVCTREELYSRRTREEDSSDVDSNCFDLTNRRQSLCLQLVCFFRTVI